MTSCPAVVGVLASRLQPHFSDDLPRVCALPERSSRVLGQLVERLLLEGSRHGAGLSDDQQRQLGGDLNFLGWQVIAIDHRHGTVLWLAECWRWTGSAPAMTCRVYQCAIELPGFR